MARKKVTIIGAGATGGQMAQWLLMQEYDVVLVDMLPGVAKAKALDLCHTVALVGESVCVVGTGLDEWGPTEGSDVIINTAGAPRKPGQTREELAKFTVEVLKKTVKPAMERSPNAFYLGFTNPMDAATQIAMEIADVPPHRIVGQGGLLDSARFRYFIAQAAKCSISEVDAMVLGGHTEKDMVPIVSTAIVENIPLLRRFGSDRVAEVVRRTRNAGKEIVELMGVSAVFAPAFATAHMVANITGIDQEEVLPCSVYYEPKQAFVGLPVRMNPMQGVRIAEDFFDGISPVERVAVESAADATRALVEEMRKSL